MDNYYSFSENIDQIVKAYDHFKSDPGNYPDWISWNPDSMYMHEEWDSDSDWKILPVYGSKEIIEGRYRVDWGLMAGMLWKCWSGVWELVFQYFNFDDVDIVAFSKLSAGQELKPHEHSEYGDNLIFHMAVEIPSGDVGIESSCGIRKWEKPGEWIIFDPKEIHSAWNRTDRDRVIFYVNFKP